MYVDFITNFRGDLKINFSHFISEDNRSLPNGTDLKFKFKIFNMGVESYKISLVIQKLTLILFPKLDELKPNKIIVLFN